MPRSGAQGPMTSVYLRDPDRNLLEVASYADPPERSERGLMSGRLVVGGIDHLVLVVADVERTVAFYRDVLGCTPVSFGEGRRALAFGDQKINLHPAGHEVEPRPARQEPGSGNLCFVTASPIADVVAALQACRRRDRARPRAAAGAQGPMTSVYLHDPDGNLLEVASYADAPGGVTAG